MATTNSTTTVSPRPLSQKRGLDNTTRQRVERISGRDFDGDMEVTRGLYSILQTFTVRPGKIFKDESFPTVIFVVMIIVDIFDIVVGVGDVTGVTWFLRVLMLNIPPTIIVILWAKKDGEKFKKELDTAIDKMISFAEKAERYAEEIGGKGAKKAGKKAGATGVKHLANRQAREAAAKGTKTALRKKMEKMVTKKAMVRAFKIFLAGVVPILTFFGLWSYFIYAFHVSKIKEKEKIDRGIQDMYKIHANTANQSNNEV